MTSVREVLSLDQWPDLVVGPEGYAAKRRVDIAPFAYEIVVNKPLRAEMMEKLVEFAGKADAELTRELFSLCNGVRIGATKFAVYGVLSQIDRGSVDFARAPALNINVPNIYGRPDGWSDDLLIVGWSMEGKGQSETEMFHAITPNGRIIAAEVSDRSCTTVRDYDSVCAWLVAEVERALKDTTRW